MHQAVIDFAELSRLSATCSKCATEIIFDAKDGRGFIPECCPVCREQFDACSEIDGYRNIFRVLSASKHKVRIRLNPTV